MTWTLYILRCGDGTLYTGITNDLSRRLAAHEKGAGAKYTRGRGPFQVAYREEHPDQGSAAARENMVKAMSRRQKEALFGERLEEKREVSRMGTLYIVGTPIGNLDDITHRALRILAEVDVIAAEDTRHTRKLLTHFGLHTPMVSYHEHNLQTQGPILIDRLRAGESVAVVTDAGMPGISDPGQHLVALAHEAAVPVVAVPGPTAVITALVVSGLATDRFCFEGFLPRQKKERAAALGRLVGEERTWVVYEAPHRLVDTLADLEKHLGARPMAACRELTKRFEEVVRGTPVELAAHFSAHPPRGEFALVVAGARAEANSDAAPEPPSPDRLAAEVSLLEAQGQDRRAAMKAVGSRYGLSRRDVYQALLPPKE